MTGIELISSLAAMSSTISIVGLVISNQFKQSSIRYESASKKVGEEVCKLNETVKEVLVFWNNQQVTNQKNIDEQAELRKENERLEKAIIKINEKGCEQRHSIHNK